jgi:hypothetical protein
MQRPNVSLPLESALGARVKQPVECLLFSIASVAVHACDVPSGPGSMSRTIDGSVTAQDGTPDAPAGPPSAV